MDGWSRNCMGHNPSKFNSTFEFWTYLTIHFVLRCLHMVIPIRAPPNTLLLIWKIRADLGLTSVLNWIALLLLSYLNKGGLRELQAFSISEDCTNSSSNSMTIIQTKLKPSGFRCGAGLQNPSMYWPIHTNKKCILFQVLVLVWKGYYRLILQLLHGE